MTEPAQGRDAWNDILDEGEKIIWQGRPEGGIVFKPKSIMTFIFGLFFAGFAFLWMVAVASSGGFFWMFGLLHFSVGIGLSFGSIFWDVWKRRHTWYTLTDRRAFIATNRRISGKQLNSYPINADTIIDYKSGHHASINFSHEMRSGKNRDYRVDIGFQRIKNGHKIHRLMLDIQEKNKS